ncbi:MAG: phosphotransferase enzyme family protein [Gammaproteobacteria bacterium]
MRPEVLACGQFLNADQGFELHPFGNGLINDTYLVDVATAKPWRFVLQRLNNAVFAHPEQVMHNLLVLSEHIERIAAAAVELQIPKPLETADGQLFYRDCRGDVWRALEFIPGSRTLDSLGNVEEAQQIGFALGHFHRLVSDLPAEELYDTLPGFHLAPDYWWQYREALAAPEKPVQCAAYEYCEKFIADRENLVNVLEDARRQGVLQQRVIHGDPKLDNFLFGCDSCRVVGLIDLDTVKPGLIHYDIGDCLRSCCRQGEPAHFDLRLCAAVLQGYLQEARHFFTTADYDYLYPAMQLLPFELGLRFFTDYLGGNRYFKVDDARHNLRRAVDQFELLQSIEEQQPQLQELLDGLIAEYL